LGWKNLFRQILEQALEKIADVGHSRGDSEQNQKRWKNGQELVEGHPAALAKNAVLPGFASGAAK
jgi:hypothetical protein